MLWNCNGKKSMKRWRKQRRVLNTQKEVWERKPTRRPKRKDKF
jgi:hypothetical protein